MTQRRDRFAAELQLPGQTSSEAVLRSLEGDDRQIWPPSPAIQQVVPQANASGRFLAGVGMAGNSHWSLSIVIDGEPQALEFDVACRVKTEPEWLGSTYQILCGRPIQIQSGAGVVIGRYLLQVEPAASLGACDVSIDHNRLRLAARQAAHGRLPRTVRWKYRVTLVEQPQIAYP